VITKTGRLEQFLLAANPKAGELVSPRVVKNFDDHNRLELVLKDGWIMLKKQAAPNASPAAPVETPATAASAPPVSSAPTPSASSQSPQKYEGKYEWRQEGIDVVTKTGKLEQFLLAANPKAGDIVSPRVVKNFDEHNRLDHALKDGWIALKKQAEYDKSDRPEPAPNIPNVLDGKTSGFQAYYSKYIAPQMTKTGWDSVHAMFPGRNRGPPT